jgi:hypothetical protein
LLPEGGKMEKKLFRVKVVLYIMAENASAACAAATQARFDIFECTAKKAGDVDAEWNDAVPYNSDDERTCAEIITNKHQFTRPEKDSAKLPAYVEAAIRVFDAGNQLSQPGQLT